MSDFPIAIIGAGFAGIGAAVRLKQEGIESFVMFERASEVGGTWRDNTYPGCACDVQSHVYSLSFEQNPNWSRRYSSWDEIQSYLVGLVDKWELHAHLRCDTEIVSAEFDEGDGVWTLTTAQGDTFTARVVISAVGGLVDPAYPQIDGIEDFEGDVFHTARWRHDVALDDRRVGVIGTGASAIQVVPSIAPDVQKLTVFQRTAGWVAPKFDRTYSRFSKRLLARVPFLLTFLRFLKSCYYELLGPIVFLDSKVLSRIGQWMASWNLRRQVKDPDLRTKLTPTFQIGCKRVLLSDDYLSTFERDNVELVTAPIRAFRPKGIETEDGRFHPFDVVVLATGYLLGLASVPFRIVGLGGRTLRETWAAGAVAYKGMAVTGFPNWFVLMGPNTGPGHTSVLVYTEAQIEHALQAIKKLITENLKYLDIRQDVMDRYNESIQRRMKYMSWSSGCKSWYLSEDGVNRSLYPGFAFEYALRTRRMREQEYVLAAFEDERPASEHESDVVEEGVPAGP